MSLEPLEKSSQPIRESRASQAPEQTHEIPSDVLRTSALVSRSDGSLVADDAVPTSLTASASAIVSGSGGAENPSQVAAIEESGSPAPTVEIPVAPEVPPDAGTGIIALLEAVMPIDVSGVGAAVSELLSELDTVYSEVEAVLPETEYAVAILGVAVGLTGYEVMRRRRTARGAPVALPTTLALERT